MHFVNVRALKLHPSKVLRRVSRHGWAIVLSHGKPTAAIMSLSEDEIEDLMLQSPAFLKSVRQSMAAYRRKGGLPLSEARKVLGL